MMTDSPTNPGKLRSGIRPQMSRLVKLCAVGLGAVLLSLMVPLYARQLDAKLQRPIGVRPKPPLPECVPIELSGTLRRPSKWNPTLDLAPAGRVRSFDLRGELLKDLPAGTHIRVKGVVRSGLHTGGTKDNPSPFPAQWYVYLLVTEVEILDDPLIVLKRQRKERDDAASVPQSPSKSSE